MHHYNEYSYLLFLLALARASVMLNNIDSNRQSYLLLNWMKLSPSFAIDYDAL
jgi:hypothetical protein